jgi:hypothetical protein
MQDNVFSYVETYFWKTLAVNLLRCERFIIQTEAV